MSFQKIVSEFIVQENLLPPTAALLVAVSGGADSVALLHVLLALGYRCHVAHCNFHLRGAESDRDELFVTSLAGKNSLPFYKADFDTRAYASAKGISIEMAARELRYRWFEKLLNEQALPVVAVAHHADDVVETFFMNQVRGTGIHGLTGIKPRQGRIVRPLLCVWRNDILLYLKENNLTHITDSSNFDEMYTRNKFRHSILPMLQQLNPSLKQTVLSEIDRLREVELIYNERMDELKASLVSLTEYGAAIDIPLLRQQKAISSVLYEILRPYQFSSQQMPLVLDLLTQPSGRQVFSSTHRVVKNRESLLVAPVKAPGEREFKIDLHQARMENPIKLSFKLLSKSEVSINKEKKYAYFDAGLLQFPLTLRRWHDGDYFYPFGMMGRKKVSDYFIDQKFSLFQKENAYLLLSGTEIIWIVGERADNRYRINESTKTVLFIEFE